MSRKTEKWDVCKNQTNIDYWAGLGPGWLQRIMEGPGGRLESIFGVPEEKAEVNESGPTCGQIIFSRRI